MLIPQLWTGRRQLFHISLPLLRCSLFRPVVPAPMSFRRTVEPPGTGYRGLLHLWPVRPWYWAGPQDWLTDQQKPFKTNQLLPEEIGYR